MKADEADWIGARKKKFRFKTFRFEYGRWYFQTDCMGRTLDSIWVWEDK